MREPDVLLVKIRLCRLCLEGVGKVCTTPGCALFLHDSPGFAIAPELYEVINEVVQNYDERQLTKAIAFLEASEQPFYDGLSALKRMIHRPSPRTVSEESA